MKNRMTKSMKLKNTDNWAKILSHVCDADNNSPHATKYAINKVNIDNEIQVLMNISQRAKKNQHVLKIPII